MDSKKGLIICGDKEEHILVQNITLEISKSRMGGPTEHWANLPTNNGKRVESTNTFCLHYIFCQWHCCLMIAPNAKIRITFYFFLLSNPLGSILLYPLMNLWLGLTFPIWTHLQKTISPNKHLFFISFTFSKFISVPLNQWTKCKLILPC